jgi:transglutaminase-like putative cysteine protease
MGGLERAPHPGRVLARTVATLTFALLLAPPSSADTLFLQGRMSSRLTLEIVERYDPAPGTNWMTLDSFPTSSFASTTWRQRVVSEQITYSVAPDAATTSRDAGGNTVLRERWNRPAAPIRIVRKLVVDAEAMLAPVESRAAFPPGAVPADAIRFLAATPLTQAEDPRIVATAKRLTAKARNEHEAVAAILNFVVDHMQYTFESNAHDALYALEQRSGNCQGYAHLSIALLRAVGIPARLTAGVSLSKGWRVSHGDGTVTFRMGQGRHGWIEVFYPDIGWIPYDPQTSHLFVSIYHIRQAIGRDASEAQGVITASPVLPAMHESIEANTSDETFAVRTTSTAKAPRSFIAAGEARMATVVAVAPPSAPPPAPAPVVVAPPAPVPPPAPVIVTPAPPPPPVATPPAPSPTPVPSVTPPAPPPPVIVVPPGPMPEPPVVVIPQAPPAPRPPVVVTPSSPVPPPAPVVQAQQLTRAVELGNTEFPAALRIFDAPEQAPQPGVVRARRTYVVETADYATGPEELAQAFTLTEPLLLSQVSLALQKFGGQTGDIWVEVLDDRGRKPGARLFDGRRLPVAALVERGGYRWVVFDVPETVLMPGRYWIVLRASGDGIFNWYFSLGSAYGDPDDTRSRRRGGADWSNILNYRFNFRLSGMVHP